MIGHNSGGVLTLLQSKLQSNSAYNTYANNNALSFDLNNAVSINDVPNGKIVCGKTKCGDKDVAAR